MKTDLIEILYSEKVILDGKRTEQDVAFSVERAARINSLMERKIFNEEFIRELQQRTPYSDSQCIACNSFKHGNKNHAKRNKYKREYAPN